MNRPWMPLYVADYLADTAHLSAAESGAYFLLLIFYRHNGNSLPDADDKLASIAKMEERDWAKVKDVILDLFYTPSHWDGVTAADRALGAGRPGRPHIPTEVKKAVRERDGDKCVYCGNIDGPFHFDHVHPWSRGGRHSTENIVIACRPCNLSKGDKTLDGWCQ